MKANTDSMNNNGNNNNMIPWSKQEEEIEDNNNSTNNNNNNNIENTNNNSENSNNTSPTDEVLSNSDLLFHIFHYNNDSWKDLLNCGSVCVQWRRVTQYIPLRAEAYPKNWFSQWHLSFRCVQSCWK